VADNGRVPSSLPAWRAVVPDDVVRGHRVPAARRRRRARAIALACTGLVAAVAGTVLRELPGPAAQVLANGTHGLPDASAVAADGPHVWAASAPEVDGVPTSPGWVSELDAGSGRLIRKISGNAYGFDDPAAVAVSGGRVWVLDSPAEAAGSVSELDAATGRPVRTIYRGIGTPTAVVSTAGQLWITSACAAGSGGFVTELATASGRVIREVVGDRYGFDCPAGIAAAHGRIWVASQSQAPAQGSGTVLSAADGRWLGTLSRGDQTGGSVTELRAVDGRHLLTIPGGFSLGAVLGSLIRSLAGRHYQFVNPSTIAAAGAHIWVASNGTASITILTAG
jgi:hypothetical protein